MYAKKTQFSEQHLLMVIDVQQKQLNERMKDANAAITLMEK